MSSTKRLSHYVRCPVGTTCYTKALVNSSPTARPTLKLTTAIVSSRMLGHFVHLKLSTTRHPEPSFPPPPPRTTITIDSSITSITTTQSPPPPPLPPPGASLLNKETVEPTPKAAPILPQVKEAKPLRRNSRTCLSASNLPCLPLPPHYAAHLNEETAEPTRRLVPTLPQVKDTKPLRQNSRAYPSAAQHLPNPYSQLGGRE